MLRPLLKACLEKAIQQGIVPQEVDLERPSFEMPPKGQEGHVATNAAFVYAKLLKTSPKALAALLLPLFKAHEDIADAHLAGAGFINVHLTKQFLNRVVVAVLEKGALFGYAASKEGERVNVEYVSVNPTGPLHAGHGRVALVGDVLANLLDAAGYRVTREYYVNDAGGQITVLARSVHLRYLEALGHKIAEIPEGCYPGSYLVDVGVALKEKVGTLYEKAAEEEWLEPISEFAVASLMGIIRKTLQMLKIQHDVFRSEKELYLEGAVDKALSVLQQKGLIETGVLPPPKGREEGWQPKPTTLFKATRFGLEQDIPLKKASDGSYTYFAGDVGYHGDKLERGFERLINVWGADHASHVDRLRAAVEGLSGESRKLDFILCQMVHILKGGKPLKLSKRAGEFMLLDELIEAIHVDVLRFLMVSRSYDTHLTLDLDEAMRTSKDNPVFYVHYAYARGCSVHKMALEMFDDVGAEELKNADLSLLTRPLEEELMRKMAFWPQVVALAAKACEPHRIPTYLTQIAGLFHALWAEGKSDTTLRFLVLEDKSLSYARLSLVQAVCFVIEAGLGILGIEPRRELC